MIDVDQKLVEKFIENLENDFCLHRCHEERLLSDKVNICVSGSKQNIFNLHLIKHASTAALHRSENFKSFIVYSLCSCVYETDA